MQIDKVRSMAQVAATGLKSAKLKVGTELTVIELVKNTLPGTETPNDSLLCETAEGNKRVPLREMFKMVNEAGKRTWSSEEGSDKMEIPGKFKVVSSTDRIVQGETQFPIQAYNDGARQIEELDFDYAKLVKSGLRGDHGMEAVQDYVIAVS